MNLLIPSSIRQLLKDSLLEAGRRKIGGIMMGEHVGVDTFRVTHVTIQKRGGTFAAFVRAVEGILGPLRAFFRTTKHQYTRFNYVGEWHSHHSFELRPSPTDADTMMALAEDGRMGALFVVLLLVRLGARDGVEGSATVFQSGRHSYLGSVVFEE